MKNIQEEYFYWMADLVQASSKKQVQLLYLLDGIPFSYSIPFDSNRYDDGVELRYRFGYERNIPSAIIASELDIRQCSVLEMMAALAFRLEEQIMTDDDKGNRTSTWFWDMTKSLGLTGRGTIVLDETIVDAIVNRFLRRDYKPNGEGGLFTIERPDTDMRHLEIWSQAMRYIDYILEDEV